MKSPNNVCALRMHRRTWGFTQRELAEFLGFVTPAHVSRIEHDKRVPGLETALACAILFDVAPSDLFPAVAEKAKERIWRILTGLSGDSPQTATPTDQRKWQLYRRILEDINDQAV